MNYYDNPNFRDPDLDEIRKETKKRRLKRQNNQKDREEQNRYIKRIKEQQDYPDKDQVINEFVNPENNKKTFSDRLGKKTLTEDEIRQAKLENSPRQINELFSEELKTIGRIIEYEYEKDENGELRYFEDSLGRKHPIVKTDADGKEVIKHQVKWDDEIKYDIRRGKEVYDSYVNNKGQRESIDEQNMIKDKALQELAGIILSEAIEEEVTDMEIVQFAHFGVVKFTQGPHSWYIHRLLYKSSVDPLITIMKHKAGLGIKLINARKPQTNGSIVFNETTSFRVASNSNQYGMTIDLRRQGKAFESLDDLDFPNLVKAEFRRNLKAKDGLTIIGGPVGSGKTTLMTAGIIERLKETNGSIKVISLEKPIEIPVAGIEQRDISDEYGISWSEAIQASLREAPTILRVGEVNEKPAANAIVRAANSGIIALTTLHIKSALEVFETLKDYDISENDIKNSLRLVIYMNRVPRLCPHCKRVESIALHQADNQWIKTRLNDMQQGAVGELAYRNPEGCAFCREGQNDKSLYGTYGKISMYELLRINKPMLRIWRKYKDYDTYVLRDMLIHPDRIHFDDPDSEFESKDLNTSIPTYQEEDPISGLMFYPLQKDILDKLKKQEIDIETAKYLLNE